jgi:HlyD family secretion protein
VSRRKWLFAVLGAVVVLLVIGVLFVRRAASSALAAVGSSRTAQVEPGAIEVRVSGTGSIAPLAQAGLPFNVSGNVGQIYVKVGDQVKTGDVLMDLDTASLDVTLISAESDLLTSQQALNDLLDHDNWQLSLAQAQADLAAARDELHTAEYTQSVRAQGNRASSETIAAQEGRVLLAKKALDDAKHRASDGTPDDHDSAQAAINLSNAQQAYDSAVRTLNWYKGHPTDIEQAQLDSAVAVAQAKVDQAQKQVDTLTNGPDPDQVRAARAQVEAAQARVNQGKLIAPFGGHVTAIYYDVGDRVTPGKIGLALADDSTYHIQTTVDELDIASVNIGQPVNVTLDALPGVTLQGKVAEIDLAPDPSATTTEYPVIVDLADPNAEARIGMTAALDILVAQKDNALLVPNWALRFDDVTGQVYVMVQENGQFTRQDVQLGLRNDTDSEVVSGLQAGQVVGVPAAVPTPAFGGGGGGVVVGG